MLQRRGKRQQIQVGKCKWISLYSQILKNQILIVYSITYLIRQHLIDLQTIGTGWILQKSLLNRISLL